MKIYLFDPSGLYLGERDARVDPADETRHLVPKNATTTAPPATTGDDVAVWDGSAWSTTVDNRETRYWTPGAGLATMTDFGALPAGATVVTGRDPWLVLDSGTWRLGTEADRVKTATELRIEALEAEIESLKQL